MVGGTTTIQYPYDWNMNEVYPTSFSWEQVSVSGIHLCRSSIQRYMGPDILEQAWLRLKKGFSKLSSWNPSQLALFFYSHKFQQKFEWFFPKTIQFALAIGCLIRYLLIQQIHHDQVRNSLLNLDMNSEIDVYIIRTKKRFISSWHYSWCSSPGCLAFINFLKVTRKKNLFHMIYTLQYKISYCSFEHGTFFSKQLIIKIQPSLFSRAYPILLNVCITT